MFNPREYQIDLSDKGVVVLSKYRIVYYACEVRLGKTFISLMTCDKMNVKSVLFITKKKAIPSIKKDYNTLNPKFELLIINFESLHKIDKNDFDIIIVDEAHSIGSYPKPSKRNKAITKIVGNKYLILMSGTPTPESYSQFYGQFRVSNYSPFTEKSFYKWAHNYVTIKKRFVAHGNQVNDYSQANEKLIRQTLSKYIISYSQKEAGFKSQIKETILHVEMQDKTYQLVKRLEKDLVFIGKKGGVILGDTPVKLLQKVHQIYSGTIKLEDGSYTIIDDSKAQYIKQYFKGQKIAIFYKFKAELELLQNIFLDHLTTDLNTFNNSNKNIALQIVAGCEGISLKKADSLVMYNIDFSAKNYWQSRDRMTTKDRLINNVFWIFSNNGIENEIYKTVQDKKSFTTNHYKRINNNKIYKNVS